MHAVPGLACPGCRGDLRADGEASLICEDCGAVYPILDGIPSFIPTSALPRGRGSDRPDLTVVIPATNRASDLDQLLAAYRREALTALELHATGFDILQEILIQMVAAGYEIREVPFHYRALGTNRAWLARFALSNLQTFLAMWKLRNSIASADYDARAYAS